jgi:hypothetical protein
MCFSSGATRWAPGQDDQGLAPDGGCVEGLDPLALEITIVDGKALPVVGAPGRR